MVKPILQSIGCVTPSDEFLHGLRRLADEHGVVLIFDENVTAFRHDLGGEQRIEGVTPPLDAMAKVVANGYPTSPVCGKERFISEFSTAGGDLVRSGTYNGYSVLMKVVTETIRLLKERNVHDHVSNV